MKLQSLFLIFVLLSMTRLAEAAAPKDKLLTVMVNVLGPLSTREGWQNYIRENRELFTAGVKTKDLKTEIDGKEYLIGIGVRTVYIKASPKVVVSVIDDPRNFQALYGLDKPADVSPKNTDGSYMARIFKLVPGIETQDFTLNYKGHWEKDTWIGEAKLVKDEKDFALRDNAKIVEPDGEGSIYREVALFHPLRWWMKLFSGTVQRITKTEMAKLNKAIKCASEKVQSGIKMSDEIGKECNLAASK